MSSYDSATTHNGRAAGSPSRTCKLKRITGFLLERRWDPLRVANTGYVADDVAQSHQSRPPLTLTSKPSCTDGELVDYLKHNKANFQILAGINDPKGIKAMLVKLTKLAMPFIVRSLRDSRTEP